MLAAYTNDDFASKTEILDAGRHSRAKLGFVLLATEQTIESDIFRLCPPGVGVHFTRAAIPDSITLETLSAQADDLARAAQTLLPDGSLDVISYACTSGSLVIGEERVFSELRKGAPSAIATSLITAVIRALRVMNIRRISVATPYLDSINDVEADYLENNGFEICNIKGLNLEKDSEMVRVKPSYIADFAASLDQDDAEAIFISCGALRSLEIVNSLEKRLGKPVIVSNQAMMWDALRLAGIQDRVEGAGNLFLNY